MFYIVLIKCFLINVTVRMVLSKIVSADDSNMDVHTMTVARHMCEIMHS
jgi:hypothetical protein